MATMETRELKEKLHYWGDFGIAKINDDPDSVMILTYQIQQSFSDLVEETFHQTVEPDWTGFKEVTINGIRLYCVLFSYLKEHPDQFPELDEFREIKTFTEEQAETVDKPAVICQYYWGSNNYALSFGTYKEAYDYFRKTMDWHKRNGFLIKYVDSMCFEAYWEIHPNIRYMKVTLVS